MTARDLGLNAERFAALERLAVRLVSRAEGDSMQVGTAVPLGGGRLLTCRHIIPERALARSGPDPRGPRGAANPPVAATIDGHPAIYQVLAAGDEAGPRGDWALIEVLRLGEGPRVDLPPTIAVEFDPAWQPRGDEPVLLLGYPAFADGDLGPVVAGRQPPFVLAARPSPKHESLEYPDQILVRARGSGAHLGGLSGGPAVVWEADRNRAVVVGIALGELRRDWLLFSTSAGNLITVRRVPPEALAGAAVR